MLVTLSAAPAGWVGAVATIVVPFEARSSSFRSAAISELIDEFAVAQLGLAWVCWVLSYVRPCGVSVPEGGWHRFLLASR